MFQPKDDPVWSDFVYWTIQALFMAEEMDATASDMPTTNLFGPLFHSMLKDTVGAGGHYGKIYQNHFENTVPRTGLNLVNDVNGPQLYAIPGVPLN